MYVNHIFGVGGQGGTGLVLAQVMSDESDDDDGEDEEEEVLPQKKRFFRQTTAIVYVLVTVSPLRIDNIKAAAV